MLVIMEPEATEEQIRRLEQRIQEMGYTPHVIEWPNQKAISVVGNRGSEDRVYLEGMQGVFKVVPVTRPYKLASREVHPDNTVVHIGEAHIGDGNVVMIAGPCAVESRDQTLRIAEEVAKRGAQILRGGAYKPRTSPYSFQGLGEQGLEILAEARERTGLPFVTEALD
ncbi:MAG: 3-deoxy-7-phosphoheptulonate synthase, partial [Candidatus Neomarinimicrobiota bacterium]